MTATFPTRWPSTLALADLPWFALRDGRLVLADRSIGPVADVHSHLALGYLGGTRVDLWRLHARTFHYLPVERPLDLDIYVNKNLRPADVRRMKLDLTLASATPWGMRATHTVPNLTREMAETGVAASLILPIDYPALCSNAETYLEVAARRPELPSLGSVHPYARGVCDRLDRQKAAGARGVKVHPAVQLVSPDDPRAIALYRACAARGLPVFFHCGPVGIEPALGRRLCQLDRYERAVAACPEATFVLGHSGALQMERALALAVGNPNVWLDLSCQSLANVRAILAHGPEERLLFGSDWPFYHQAIPLAKVLTATEGRPALRAKVLWGNAARLFGLAAPAQAAA